MQLIELIKTNAKISKNCWKKYSSAEINYQDKNGDTPLHFAVRLEKIEIINNLLNNKNTQFNLQNKIKVIPLIEAIMINNDEITTLLIEPTVKAKAMFLRNIDNQDSLMLLIKNKKWDIVKLLFRKIGSMICNEQYAKYIFRELFMNHQWHIIELMLNSCKTEWFMSQHLKIIIAFAAKDKCWSFVERMLKRIKVWKVDFDNLKLILTLTILEKKWGLVAELISKIVQEMDSSNSADLFTLLIQNKKWNLCSNLIDKISLKLFNAELFISIAIEIMLNEQHYIVYQLLQKLINYGLDKINSQLKHMPLCFAIILKEEELALNLIEEIPINELTLDSKYGLLTLRLTVLHNMVNIADKIIQKLPKGNINFQAEDGSTFLHWVLRYPNLEFIKMIKYVSQGTINFNLKTQKDEIFGSLLSDEIKDIFKVGKIGNNYFEFIFKDLDDEAIANNWEEIKQILVNINEIIDEIKKSKNNLEIINEITILPIEQTTITIIEQKIAKTIDKSLKQSLLLYCDNFIQIIALKSKVTVKTVKEIEVTNNLNSKTQNLEVRTQTQSYQAKDLNSNFQKRVSLKSGKKNQFKQLTSNFTNSKKTSVSNGKSKTLNFVNNTRTKKNSNLNRHYTQENIAEITESMKWIKKQIISVNNEKVKKSDDNTNKMDANDSFLATSNLQNVMQLYEDKFESEKQRFLVADNIKNQIYRILRTSELDHDGRPAIIIGKDKKNPQLILVLLGTTKIKINDDLKIIIQLTLNEQNITTNFYNNAFKWIEANNIIDNWATKIQLSESQKQEIAKFLLIEQLNKLQIESF